jgi:anaerobic C4-dicarboxylate transporter DcuA
MWIVELLIVLFFIWLGARIGSIGIGFAGGFGVLVLSVGFGLKPGSIPIDVILIIMGVISAIAAMQEAGGLDYLVLLAEKVLKSNPKYITFLAPIVTYTITIFAGTGLTALMTLPVIGSSALPSACHCNGCISNCHYRLSHICSSDFFCIRA